MYRDLGQRTKIRRWILVDQVPIRQVARRTGISRNTIRKMLASRLPKLRPSSGKPESPSICHRTINRIISPSPKSHKRAEAKNTALEWMRRVLQKQLEIHTLRAQVGDLPAIGSLADRLYEGGLTDRDRSMVVLANRHGIGTKVICSFLGIDPRTARRYLRTVEVAGASGLFARQEHSNRKFDDPLMKNAVFGLLHEPPSNYDINRTTWTMTHLYRVLKETGRPVSSGVIRKIVKLAGYRWRKARVVLTSPDPAFSEKLNRIRSILSKLRPNEAFFSIDEFGPFAVKMKSGIALTGPGERRIVPQWQKSRGRLILTAALELSENQTHHFFSTKKNTAEMIRMMELLISRYRDRCKIYLSWDAASWHISKQLYKVIEQHNAAGDRPAVETAPLPSGAQFLNVIESVFSGMARAIIHNSDYITADHAKAAIDRYFFERNEHFKQHPRRAGDKIWGKERAPAVFSESNNCKDPRYR
jgi:transposase